MSARPPRVRIAPSPTGSPHVGTAYVALFNRSFARKHGGKFILRIEDTDRARSTRASEEAIYLALRWLGLDWDEGPDVGGPHAPYRQSERTGIYQEHARRLLDSEAAYRCFCTPERLAALRHAQKEQKLSTFGYDGACRAIAASAAAARAAAGEPFVVRLKVPAEGATTFADLLRKPVVISHREIDDQVLLKSDGFPTYHLANVVDDHLMEISHVLRAEEWIPSTPKHILIYAALGWEPPVFCHLPLLRNQDKTKISKRKNPTSLTWYQEQGFLPEALLNFLCLMGWKPKDEAEVFGLDRFLDEFEPEQINPTGPVFDLAKLEWLNGEYIRALAPAELGRRLTAFLGRDLDPARLAQVIPLVRERLKKLGDFDQVAGFLYRDRLDLDPAEFLAAKKLTPQQRLLVLDEAARLLAATASIDSDTVETPLRAFAERHGMKVGDVFMVLRVAVTGSRASPPLVESMAVLGAGACRARVARARALLAGPQAAGPELAGPDLE